MVGYLSAVAYLKPAVLPPPQERIPKNQRISIVPGTQPQDAQKMGKICVQVWEFLELDVGTNRPSDLWVGVALNGGFSPK